MTRSCRQRCAPPLPRVPPRAPVPPRAAQISWKERVVHEYNLDLTPKRPPVHIRIGAEGWGLTYNGSSLLLTDSRHLLYHVEPFTAEVLA